LCCAPLAEFRTLGDDQVREKLKGLVREGRFSQTPADSLSMERRPADQFRLLAAALEIGIGCPRSPRPGPAPEQPYRITFRKRIARGGPGITVTMSGREIVITFTTPG
jgi:hypothetical protein